MSFYQLLDDLRIRSGARLMRECNGRSLWPVRGVYFFFENGELRSDSGSGNRVVRVGTHALKNASQTTLWTRLSQHKGQQKTGGGNHRGSIFRLLVGEAILKRDKIQCETWGQGNTASRSVREQELEIEQRVSEYIGAMSFLVIGIEDIASPDSLRGVVERNSIALLSNAQRRPLDGPSSNWLGNYSNRARVRASGLWNQNHVEEVHDPDFLNILDALIRKQ